MAMFYGLSTDMAYLSKTLNLYVGLSPHTVFTKPGVLIKLQAQILQMTYPVLKQFKIFTVLAPSSLDHLIPYACGYMPGLCQFVLHFLVTSDTSPINYDALRIFLGHYPSGSGINCLIHYIQMHSANQFQEFDHGSSKNL